MTDPVLSLAEANLASAAEAAVNRGSRQPWGMLRAPLAAASGVDQRDTRAIGMQDDSVIDRAIGSPGMNKPKEIHGFVVYPGTNYATAFNHVKVAVETQSTMYTAVLMDGNRGFQPTDVISRVPARAAFLTGSLPNAAVTAVTRVAPTTGPTLETDPWTIVLDDESLAQRAASLIVGKEEGNARCISPGDRVLLVDATGDAHAAGVVASLTHDKNALIVALQPCRYFPQGAVSLP